MLGSSTFWTLRSAIAKNFLEDANGELTHQEEGSTFLKFKIWTKENDEQKLLMQIFWLKQVKML